MELTEKGFDNLNLSAAEFDDLGIPAGQLDNMSYEDFLKLLAAKLDRFKQLPNDRPIPDEISSEISKIHQTAITEISSLNVAAQNKWSKRPTEILFEIILANLVQETGKQLPHLVAWIISVINQLLN